jgi:hypothetical protein
VPPEVLSDAAVVARDVGETSGGKVSQEPGEDLSGISNSDAERIEPPPEGKGLTRAPP